MIRETVNISNRNKTSEINVSTRGEVFKISDQVYNKYKLHTKRSIQARTILCNDANSK